MGRFIESDNGKLFFSMDYILSAKIEHMIVLDKEEEIFYYYVVVKMSDGKKIRIDPSKEGVLEECISWCRYVFNTNSKESE